jgi:4-amino-4-deoxy-L-arabinose transferase-like glycosyltransferase
MLTVSKRTKIILLVLILAIAVFFRLYKLAEIPPALYPDVAINGNDALDAIKTDYKVFYPENNGREGLFMNLIAASFLTFGVSVWAIKIVAALFGIFTVLGMYLLTRQLFKYLGNSSNSDIVALLATFFIAVSFWHVNFSRIGFRAIMVPFFLVWGLYFIFKGFYSDNKKVQIVNFAIAGLFFGLGFHTYIAFRIAPIIIIPLFIIWIIKNRPRLKLAPWLILVIFALLAAGPLLYYYAKNPADFMGRAGQVSIFAVANPILTLIQSTTKTLGQFVAIGDYNWRHNFSGSPEIFWPLIPFFIIGIFYSLIQIFRKKNYAEKNYPLLSAHWILLFAWGAMLLPSVISYEGLPHALRSIGAIIPSYVFTAIGFYLVIQRVYREQNYLKIKNILIFIFFLAILFFSYRMYFIDWANNPNVKGAFEQRFADEAEYLNSLPSNIQKYVIVNEKGVAVPYPDGIPMPSQTIMFLTRINQPETIVSYFKQDEISKLPNCQDCSAIILPMKYDTNLFDQIKQKYPRGKIENLGEFSVLKIGF